MLNKYLPFVLYTIGSLFFVAGSLVAMYQMWRGK